MIVLTGLLIAGLAIGSQLAPSRQSDLEVNQGRSEVLFWHFWGGADRAVVDDVVQRFNESQNKYFVRAVAMPGNNLQAKLFLATAGGDPPDLVNQDDPIVGDWAARGLIQSLESVVSAEEAALFHEHLLESARSLGTWNQELFAICNGLDIRALYYNQTALAERGLQPPATIEDLDGIARTFCPPGSERPDTFGYLPDSRRLWAWGYVFGGDFYDAGTGQVTLTSPGVVQAAQWMSNYSDWYGADTINRFRQGDQSLPGKTFPLLPILDQEQTGRYVCLMDGQWRVRDIEAFRKRRLEAGLPCPQFGVCPLPVPEGGRRDAGWVNGNFFVMPRGARNPQGAVAFMKFWIGMTDPDQAAKTCVAGGWIPVSRRVSQTPGFQDFLQQQPLFEEFVRLAASANQFPVPVIPGATLFKREVEKVAADVMNDPNQPIESKLNDAGEQIQAALDRRINGQGGKP